MDEHELNEIIGNAEKAIEAATNAGVHEFKEGARLIAALGETMGALKTLKGFNLKQIMYDMARLAAAAGHTPGDFEDKAIN